MGGRAANGEGGKLGAGLGSRTKVEVRKIRKGGGKAGDSGSDCLPVPECSVQLHWTDDVTVPGFPVLSTKSSAQAPVIRLPVYLFTDISAKTCSMLNTFFRSGQYNKKDS